MYNKSNYGASGVVVLLYRQDSPVFFSSRDGVLSYGEFLRFREGEGERKRKRERESRRDSTFRADRVLRLAVRAFGAVTFTSMPHFQRYTPTSLLR